MGYSDEDKQFIKKHARKAPSEHVRALNKLIEAQKPYSDVFAYGINFLPKVKDENTGSANLERLADYRAEIVEYFEILSELPSLPDTLRELATDLAICANGESIQTDSYYLNLDYDAALKKALLEASVAD